MILNKYLVALLQVLTLFLAAFQAALSDGLTATEAWQLAGLFVGAVVTYYVPILTGRWAAALKVGGAVLGAAIAALVLVLADGWSAGSVTIVIIAIINALATQFGVDVRLDSTREALTSPTVTNVTVDVVDPSAAAAVADPTHAVG